MRKGGERAALDRLGSVAQFEANSYGFRPGRSPHDAIFNQIRYTLKWVLDADIAQCIDRIDHSALLEKIDTIPRLKRQVKAWLKAGVWDNGDVFPNKQGTPQGSILSPLLANIALHGMENVLKAFAETLPGGRQKNRAMMSLIRFADDLVVMHPQREVIEQCRERLQQWLGKVGLELKASKTRIAHTQDEGFDFFGFHIQQYRVGKHQSGRRSNGQRLGFKTITTSSKSAIKKHWHQLVEVIDRHKAAPQAALIKNLNPVIWGWSNYFKTKYSKRAFSRCDHLIWISPFQNKICSPGAECLASGKERRSESVAPLPTDRLDAA